MVSVEINMVLLLMQINLRRTVFEVLLLLSKCNVSDSSLRKLDRATLKNCYQRTQFFQYSFVYRCMGAQRSMEHWDNCHRSILNLRASAISIPATSKSSNLSIYRTFRVTLSSLKPTRNTTLSYYQFVRAIFVSKITSPNVKIVILYYLRLISKQDTETRVKRTNIRFSIGRH